MPDQIGVQNRVAHVQHGGKRWRQRQRVDIELMRLSNARCRTAIDDVGPEAFAQIPEDVRPDLAVVVRLAEEAEQARPVAVGLAVDAAEPARADILGERRIAVDAVREEVAAAFADCVRFVAVERRVEPMADAVMVLVQHDVEVVVAVEIERTVTVEVASPAARPVPQEHADRRTRAVGGGLERGVVTARGAREAHDRIATEAAAPEVVDLEIAGGLVETEIVEEVVREVEREEERRLRRPRSLEREIEDPSGARQDARLGLRTNGASKDVRVVAGESARCRKDGGGVAERRREVAKLVVHDGRALGGTGRARVGPSGIRHHRRRGLQYSPLATGVEHAVAAEQDLRGLRIHHDVVELRLPDRLDADPPGQSQGAPSRDPDLFDRDILLEAAPGEAYDVRVVRRGRRAGIERQRRTHVLRGGRCGIRRADGRCPAPALAARGGGEKTKNAARRRDVDGDFGVQHLHAIECLPEHDVSYAVRRARVVTKQRQRLQVGRVEAQAGRCTAQSARERRGVLTHIERQIAGVRFTCYACPAIGGSAARCRRGGQPIANVEVRQWPTRILRLLPCGRRARLNEGEAHSQQADTYAQRHDTPPPLGRPPPCEG